jgi:hypothetical protein
MIAVTIAVTFGRLNITTRRDWSAAYPSAQTPGNANRGPSRRLAREIAPMSRAGIVPRTLARPPQTRFVSRSSRFTAAPRCCRVWRGSLYSQNLRGDSRRLRKTVSRGKPSRGALRKRVCPCCRSPHPRGKESQAAIVRKTRSPARPQSFAIRPAANRRHNGCIRQKHRKPAQEVAVQNGCKPAFGPPIV